MNPLAHRRIVLEAFEVEQPFAEDALRWLVRGNLRSDLFQMSPERHFDNAPDREGLGRMWETGFKRFLDEAVHACAPPQPDRREALLKLGEASHSLADFYAHTNWVEIHCAKQAPNVLAPLVGDTFEPARFPAGLESGYYSLRYGVKGCPKRAGIYQPPEGFRWCHETLAKDYPNKGHGAERCEPGGETFFELACGLAVQATRELWQYFYQTITDRYGEEAMRLTAWGNKVRPVGGTH